MVVFTVSAPDIPRDRFTIAFAPRGSRTSCTCSAVTTGRSASTTWTSLISRLRRRSVAPRCRALSAPLGGRESTGALRTPFVLRLSLCACRRPWAAPARSGRRSHPLTHSPTAPALPPHPPTDAASQPATRPIVPLACAQDSRAHQRRDLGRSPEVLMSTSLNENASTVAACREASRRPQERLAFCGADLGRKSTM